MEIGLWFNFGKSAEMKRKLFENRYKRHSDSDPEQEHYQNLLKE